MQIHGFDQIWEGLAIFKTFSAFGSLFSFWCVSDAWWCLTGFCSFFFILLSLSQIGQSQLVDVKFSNSFFCTLKSACWVPLVKFSFELYFYLQSFYLVHFYFCHFLDILYLNAVSLALWIYFFRADSLLSSSVYCGGTSSTLSQARQSTLAFPSRLRGASRSSEVFSGPSWPHTQPWACMWPSRFPGISQSFSKLLWTAPSPALPFKLCG